jgi:general secretion pathway protein G
VFRRRNQAPNGTTLLELMISTAILAILAGAALPVAEVSSRRRQEIELRRALRDVRIALDTYHRVCVSSIPGQANATPTDPTGQSVTFVPEDDPDRTCWPKDLEVLVEGIETNIPGFKLRFLRRMPQDPFNRDGDEYDQMGWRLRSTSDNPDGNLSWDRKNVFDVSSGAEYRALDGSYYKDW